MAVRRLTVLYVAGAIVAVLGLSALASHGVRYRARVIVHKATGALPDVTWSDLAYMLDPRSGMWIERLADDPNPYASLTTPLVSAEDRERGRQIFTSRCAGCHAVDASGGTAPALVGRLLAHGDSDWAVFQVIRRGVPGTAMTAQPLSRAETWQVISHIRTLARAPGAVTSATASGAPAAPASYPPVTFARLRAANGTAGEDGWLTYSGGYNGQRYSAVSQIDRGNAAKLRVAWIRPIDGIGSENVQATPLVNGDLMFFTVPPQRVMAVSARTGAVLWEYSRAVPGDLVRGYGSVNRGVALLGDQVFVGTLDGHLVALEARSGRVRWDVEVATYRDGYTITAAPLAIDGLIVTGTSGGDYPIRGYIDAYDAGTGQRTWRLYTIPAPGEPGSDTWSGDSWRVGGAAPWLTGSFDPESNVLFWGVGNPSPAYAGDLRTGDNLFSNSALAIDAATGRLIWHYQFTPGDEYDWDAAQVPVLADLSPWRGRARSILWANRNGFFYVLDAASGAFERARPFVRQNWASGFDAAGRPIKVPGISPSARGTLVYPHKYGGASWWPPAFSPKTGLFYTPTFDGPMLFFRSGTPVPDPREQYLGGSFQNVDEPPIARIKALSPASGEVVWEYRPARGERRPPMGLLSTGGQLVFASHDTRLLALDASSGALLWQFDTGQPVRAAPMTYVLDGRQYVAVAAGALLLSFNLPVE